ncbi:MAG: NifU family protein [Oligoflexia bacterium]|nr:NifU family protein [Oligoflexia bacterium]
MNIEAKDVLIRMLATPNPYALKFVLNVPLKNKGRATFYSKEDCVELPLFHSLFDISGIKQIFVFQNQMTITHDGGLSEQEIEKQVTAVVGTRIAVHKPDFLSFEEQQELPSSSASSGSSEKKKSAEVLKVEQILDRTVRPGLQADGGDLEVLSVDKNEVRISYQGACGGCPSAMMGTLEAIENILRHETGRESLKVIPV